MRRPQLLHRLGAPRQSVPTVCWLCLDLIDVQSINLWWKRNTAQIELPHRAIIVPTALIWDSASVRCCEYARSLNLQLFCSKHRREFHLVVSWGPQTFWQFHWRKILAWAHYDQRLGILRANRLYLPNVFRWCQCSEGCPDLNRIFLAFFSVSAVITAQ
jgi:hypothetical protein